MPEETGYQGWKNYETWAVKLWLDNEEPSYNAWRGTTEDVWENEEANSYSTKSQVARRVLADRLKEVHEEALPELTGFAADLLTAAMGEVDWFEIANSMLEAAELDEYEPAE